MGFGVPHYEVLCPFHVASVFKLTQMSHVPANVATRLPSRTYEPRLMNSALSLGFGSVGSVGGNYSGTKLHSLFSAILVVATELLLLLGAACVGVKVGVCVCVVHFRACCWSLALPQLNSQLTVEWCSENIAQNAKE